MLIKLTNIDDYSFIDLKKERHHFIRRHFLFACYAVGTKLSVHLILQLLYEVDGVFSTLQTRNQDLERLPDFSRLSSLPVFKFRSIRLKSSGFFPKYSTSFYFTHFISCFYIFIAFIPQNKTYRNAFILD